MRLLESVASRRLSAAAAVVAAVAAPAVVFDCLFVYIHSLDFIHLYFIIILYIYTQFFFVFSIGVSSVNYSHDIQIIYSYFFVVIIPVADVILTNSICKLKKRKKQQRENQAEKSTAQHTQTYTQRTHNA